MHQYAYFFIDLYHAISCFYLPSSTTMLQKLEVEKRDVLGEIFFVL